MSTIIPCIERWSNSPLLCVSPVNSLIFRLETGSIFYVPYYSQYCIFKSLLSKASFYFNNLFLCPSMVSLIRTKSAAYSSSLEQLSATATSLYEQLPHTDSSLTLEKLLSSSLPIPTLSLVLSQKLSLGQQNTYNLIPYHDTLLATF